MKHVHPASEAIETAGQHDWGSLRWLAGKAVGNSDKLAMAYVVIKQAEHNPRHRHNTCDEVLYLISGTLDHSLGDEHFRLEAGDTLTVPAGVFHNAVNVGTEDAHMIVVYSSPERDFELEAQ